MRLTLTFDSAKQHLRIQSWYLEQVPGCLEKVCMDREIVAHLRTRLQEWMSKCSTADSVSSLCYYLILTGAVVSRRDLRYVGVFRYAEAGEEERKVFRPVFSFVTYV